MGEDVSAALVDQIHHPFHPWEQKFVDVTFGEEQPLLRSQVFSDVGECHLPRYLLIDAARVLVGEVEELVQAVVDDFRIERQVHVCLF